MPVAQLHGGRSRIRQVILHRIDVDVVVAASVHLGESYLVAHLLQIFVYFLCSLTTTGEGANH